MEIPLFPEQASTLAPSVDHLFYFLLAVGAFFAGIIFLLVFYFAIRYRRRSGDEIPEPPRESLRLEVAWTVIPLILTAIMFGWGAKLYFQGAVAPPGALEIFVVGKQWMWKLQHPEGKREINELHIPVGRPIKLTMTSEDVIHDFFVPAFRIKKDVLPGQYTGLWFEATQTGRYHLFCSQYCGTSHSLMGGWVIVMEPAEYSQWLSGFTPAESMETAGEKLFQQLACATCHLENGSGRGPSLRGLYGKPVELEDGRIVIADEGYIRESILSPAAKIVKGYQPIMPTFRGLVSEEQLLQLIAYIKSLRSPEGKEPEK